MIDYHALGRAFAHLNGKLGFDCHGSYRFFMSWWIPKAEQALSILRRHQFFLVLAAGRSGTNWLASLLNRAEGVLVGHEPVPAEFHVHGRTCMDRSLAVPYLESFRLGEMALRCRIHKPERYGEVNPLLLFHAAAFKQFMPGLPIIQLVRDGRNVVRSGMARVFFTRSDTRGIAPPTDSVPPESWQTMCRFEKLCWFWAFENAYLRQYAQRTVRLEDLLEDYETLKTDLLNPLGLSLPRSLWENAKAKPRNVSKLHEMGPWSEWSETERRQFKEICGEEMSYNGYDLEKDPR